MTKQSTFFGVPSDHPPPDRSKAPKPDHAGRYGGNPGSGPVDETCGSCRYLVRDREGMRKNIPKCNFTRHLWKQPDPSELLLSAPACEKWKRGEALL